MSHITEIVHGSSFAIHLWLPWVLISAWKKPNFVNDHPKAQFCCVGLIRLKMEVEVPVSRYRKDLILLNIIDNGSSLSCSKYFFPTSRPSNSSWHKRVMSRTPGKRYDEMYTVKMMKHTSRHKLGWNVMLWDCNTLFFSTNIPMNESKYVQMLEEKLDPHIQIHKCKIFIHDEGKLRSTDPKLWLNSSGNKD